MLQSRHSRSEACSLSAAKARLSKPQARYRLWDSERAHSQILLAVMIAQAPARITACAPKPVQLVLERVPAAAIARRKQVPVADPAQETVPAKVWVKVSVQTTAQEIAPRTTPAE